MFLPLKVVGGPTVGVNVNMVLAVSVYQPSGTAEPDTVRLHFNPANPVAYLTVEVTPDLRVVLNLPERQS